MLSRIHLLAAALLVALLAACTTTDPRTSAEYTAAQAAPARLAGRTILLLPADVECGQVTAGGMVQPNAAWTATAEANVMAALERSFAGRGATLVTYDPAGLAADRAELHDRVLKLNEAVGGSIFFLQDVLPTKRAVFEWSVGEGARHLGDDFDADYALFVYLRDTHASAGLVGMNVLKGVVGLATGYVPGMTSGIQVGFAQLVDLETGNVIWFNKLSDTSAGADLRTAPKAGEAVDALLRGCPI
jgi:hypothetical protein